MFIYSIPGCGDPGLSSPKFKFEVNNPKGNAPETFVILFY